MKTVQDLIDEYKDTLTAIPGVANVGSGPDGKSAFRVWVDDEKTRVALEKLLTKDLDGFPVIVQEVYRGEAL